MRDTAGATSSATLTVTVQGANDAPVLAAQTANQTAVVGSPFSAAPGDTFTDVEAAIRRTYAATEADGRRCRLARLQPPGRGPSPARRAAAESAGASR